MHLLNRVSILSAVLRGDIAVKVSIQQWSTSHVRFLLIDEKELYHIGASLKDLGKKWFGFSRMDSLAQDVLNKLIEDV